MIFLALAAYRTRVLRLAGSHLTRTRVISGVFRCAQFILVLVIPVKLFSRMSQLFLWR